MSKLTVWQKSSYSEANGPECVEVARAGPGVAFRESDDPHTVVSASCGALGGLIGAVKAGALRDLCH